MRLPKATDLDSDQQSILDAPLAQNLFVAGPPGSGKTVVACYRARAAGRRGGVYKLIMFTNVLSRYTGNGDVDAFTKDRWLKGWWKGATGQWRLPQTEIEGQYYRPADYHQMQREFMELDPLPDAADWGHLVIDEGQDFPKDFYALLNLVAGRIERETSRGRPVLTVLADENQRITNEHSTIAEIRSALQLAECNCHSLTKNYRNTRNIAAFANHFSVGLETGTGDPVATRDGDIPMIVRANNRNDAVERIARHANNFSDREIGVLVYRQDRVKSFYNRLVKRLGEDRVQAFSNKMRKEFPANKLEFDKPGKVTILCFASAKGLEFDSVFLPDLQIVDVSAGNEEIFKMTMFVMCSRARQYLELCYLQDDKAAKSVVSWLPEPDTGLAKFEDLTQATRSRKMQF